MITTKRLIKSLFMNELALHASITVIGEIRDALKQIF